MSKFQICGLRYTQAVSRDQRQDEVRALALVSLSGAHGALMYLHGLGYDCADAFVMDSRGKRVRG